MIRLLDFINLNRKNVSKTIQFLLRGYLVAEYHELSYATVLNGVVFYLSQYSSFSCSFLAKYKKFAT